PWAFHSVSACGTSMRRITAIPRKAPLPVGHFRQVGACPDARKLASQTRSHRAPEYCARALSASRPSRPPPPPTQNVSGMATRASPVSRGFGQAPFWLALAVQGSALGGLHPLGPPPRPPGPGHSRSTEAGPAPEHG